MATTTRNFRLDNQLIKDLTYLAEQDQRSLNQFVAIQLQKVVDTAQNGGQISIQDLTQPTHQIKPQETPKTNFAVNIEPPKPLPIQAEFDVFKVRIKECTWSGDLEKVMKEIKNSLLAGWMKKQLDAMALEQRKEFTN